MTVRRLLALRLAKLACIEVGAFFFFRFCGSGSVYRTLIILLCVNFVAVLWLLAERRWEWWPKP